MDDVKCVNINKGFSTDTTNFAQKEKESGASFTIVCKTLQGAYFKTEMLDTKIWMGNT